VDQALPTIRVANQATPVQAVLVLLLSVTQQLKGRIMSHFAYVLNGIVQEVIVAEQDFIDGLEPRPGFWVQTSYNTCAGVHRTGGTPLRKNYAGIGYVYDAERDAFYSPKPFYSWILNEDTCTWEPPVAPPMDGQEYAWNEYTHTWDLVEHD